MDSLPPVQSSPSRTGAASPNELKYSSLPATDSTLVARWRSSIEDPTTRLQFVRLLNRVPFFGDTTEAFRASICQAMLPVEYKMGQTVFQLGELGDWMGVLISGRLDRQAALARTTGDVLDGTVDTKVGEVTPGGIVGDIGLLGVNEKRTVTVVAAQASTLLVIEGRVFWDIVHQQPEVPQILEDALEMQNLMADHDELCQLECFKKLDRDFVRALCEHLEPRLLYPKMILMRENNYGNEMYVLQRGKVRIEKGGKFLVNLYGGVVIGELAVLGADKRRTATVICEALSLVYVLHGDVFHQMLEKFPGSKRVFDHAFITRLVSFELAKVKGEMDNLNNFYGKAQPLPMAQMMQEVYGVRPKQPGDGSDEGGRRGRGKRTATTPRTLPRIGAGGGTTSGNNA